MTDDLGFDFARAAPWFPHDKVKPYVLVRVSDVHANGPVGYDERSQRGEVFVKMLPRGLAP